MTDNSTLVPEKLALGSPGPTDSDLLGRFIEHRDQTAFATLLERHGPMVLGVCRRVLGHAQDAEDAFQATFLVLARKAHRVLRRASLGSWLYGVACRVSLGACRRMNRISTTLSDNTLPTAPPDQTAVEQEMLLILDE